MPSKATNRVLTDHDEIREWVEERGGSPARVKGTGGDGDVGMLRIDFPGYSGEGSLEHISWDEFFQKFDESGLALLVQDETASGERSNFNKIVSRETAQQAEKKTSVRSALGRSRAATQTHGTAPSAGRSRSTTSAVRKKATKASGRSRSATTTARASAARKKGGSAAQSQAKKKTAARSSSRKANAKSKSKKARKTSGSQKIITMRTSKSASSATKKSNRGHRRAA
jgi:hypothetical protein